jgi:2-dehydro-3-deoxy-D-gluconate 5-dehydrogenase
MQLICFNEILIEGQVIDVNLKATFLLCQSAGRHMVPLRRGKIINIASLNTFIGGDQVAPYTASKGGVGQLTKALSNEWAKHNVQVNALAPGFIATDMFVETSLHRIHTGGRSNIIPGTRI